MAKPRLFVQAGQRIGRGVVIVPEMRIPGSGRNKTFRVAKLICDCGTEYVAKINCLIGKTAEDMKGIKSCGCLSRERLAAGRALGPEAMRGRRAPNFIDRTGQRYGALVAIELGAPRYNSLGRPRTHWLCRCDCGNEVEVALSSLTRGNTRSCGCQWHAPRRPPGVAARNRVLKAYKGSARSRGLAWELTDEEFDRLVTSDCHYCGAEPSMLDVAGPSEFLHGGIDRMDNNLGYTAANCAPACATCNRAKWDKPYEVFMAWIAQLTMHHWFSPDVTPSRLLKGGA
jgi:hypothetical protein